MNADASVFFALGYKSRCGSLPPIRAALVLQTQLRAAST
jgi:hypothetical protein